MNEEIADRVHWFRHEICKAILEYGGDASTLVPDEGLIRCMREMMGLGVVGGQTDSDVALIALRATLRSMLSDYGFGVSEDITNEGLVKKLTEALDGTPDGTKSVLKAELLGTLAEGDVNVPAGSPDSAVVSGVYQLVSDINKLKSAICKASSGRDAVEIGDPLYRFCNTVSFLGYGKAKRRETPSADMPSLRKLAKMMHDSDLDWPGNRNLGDWEEFLRRAIADVVSETVGAAIERVLGGEQS